MYLGGLGSKTSFGKMFLKFNFTANYNWGGVIQFENVVMQESHRALMENLAGDCVAVSKNIFWNVSADHYSCWPIVTSDFTKIF